MIDFHVDLSLIFYWFGEVLWSHVGFQKGIKMLCFLVLILTSFFEGFRWVLGTQHGTQKGVGGATGGAVGGAVGPKEVQTANLKDFH